MIYLEAQHSRFGLSQHRIFFMVSFSSRRDAAAHRPTARDENGMDIFRPYSKPNPFRGVEIYPYPIPDIQHPIPYPYPNTQITYYDVDIQLYSIRHS